MASHQLNIRLVMSTVSQTKSASKKAIVAFFKRRKPGSMFDREHFLDQVYSMVNKKQSFVPVDSAILRDLRKLRAKGVLDYTCVQTQNGQKYKVTSIPS